MGVGTESSLEAVSEARTTRRLRRVFALTAYAAVLTIWTLLIGMPNDTVFIFLWIWLASVAWNIEAPRRDHLNFLVDWWPPVLGLVLYFYSRGLVDNLGFAVSVQTPIDVDRWLFGGHLPTEVLQQHLCGDPCLRTSSPRWYDVLLTTVYASHFVAGLSIAGVLWIRSRDEWQRWMRRLLAISYAALAIYLLYPMAPPWWAAKYGYLPVPLPRLTTRGWDDLGIERFNVLLGGVGNEVAAMPSLHTGIAVLIALYGVQRLRSPWRWLLLAYPVLMGVALVYYAEHYVVDVLAAIPLAIGVLVGCSWWERRRPPVASEEAAVGQG